MVQIRETKTTTYDVEGYTYVVTIEDNALTQIEVTDRYGNSVFKMYDIDQLETLYSSLKDILEAIKQ